VSPQTLEKIQSDFDRIARLLSTRPERPGPYDPFILRQVPEPCDSLLDVGSGSGRMARLLSARARSVLAIDASPAMTELARARSGSVASLRFLCADFMAHDFGHERYDCVFSVTTLHHLPHGAALERMKMLLKPGGVLVIHDLRATAGWRDWISSGVRATTSGEIIPWLARRLGNRGEIARAWRDHGATDEYLRMPAVRTLVAAHLPGARVIDHPLWRYTVVWRNAPAPPP
jgi:ubiquinone/menaquinone biosynthesis C-methylase UbiE